MRLAHLHRKDVSEPVWHVELAVLAAIFLELALNNHLVVGPKYVIAGFEVLLLFSLVAFEANLNQTARQARRLVAFSLLALISLANFFSLGLVVHSLLSDALVSGHELIISGIAIYVTNIIIFGLWYWELDGASEQSKPEFLFAQMTVGGRVSAQPTWQPTFFDYFYISVTNATAFSPTDTLPLTHRAKALMAIQSIASILTIALVAARAVNILS